MDRLSPIKVILPLLLIGLTGSAMSANERKPSEMQRGPVTNPHGASLKTPCGSCHTSTSWTPIRTVPEFDHNRETKFPLRGMHEKVQCGLCHTKLVFTNVGNQCADCHADIHRGQFGAKCEDCHTVNGWQDSIKSVREHSARFPLIGAHASVTCDSCHVSAAVGRFVGLSTQCASCHINDFNSAASVNHKAAGFSVMCETCHNMTSWLGVKFDHSTTGFILAGAHAQLACATCHVGGRFKGTPADCFSCHVKDFNGTDNPPHAAAGFPRDCSVCHNSTDWNNAKFDHNMSTFPLTGAHVNVACTTCHVGGRFAGTPSACFSCHVTDFNGTTNPNHRAAGLPTDCSTCHNTANWQNAKFDHNLTKFPLTGAHVTLACATCHVGGQFANESTTCVGCHLADFKKTTSPNHVTAGYPQDCTVCHTTTAWQPASFDHSKTGFALTGAHTTVQCQLCHVSSNFATTPTQCSGCHMPDFQKTNSPNHAATGIPTNCEVCHVTAAWTPAKFDHSKTSFPLTGAHVQTQCALCHVNNNFTTLPTQCSGCHLTDFNKTTSPNHVSSGFPTDCTLCHTTAVWKPSTFDHSKTAFPLTGTHVTTACAQCHVNNNFTTVPTNCVGCHLTDFKKTTNPNHVTAGFSQDCQVCHSTVNWLNAVFDHSKTTFPLTGAHAQVQCALCHVNNNFTTVPTQCSGCHLPDFNKTTNPNHVKSGFPQTCESCHTTTAWQPASFDHSKTGFPLTGGHVALQCAQCHVNGNYTLAAAQALCSNCHMTDYNGTTNPAHKAAGFPTDCTLCHTTANWTSATFNHNTTGFPLTGFHTTMQCAQCHVNNNYAIKTALCSDCHTTDYNATNNPPHKAAGFPTDCTLCHTTANWTSATFNHNTTGFPLTGFHTTMQCAQCHVNNNYAIKTALCSDCHTTDYNATNNPPHKAAGFPTDCTLCHTTANWTSATFNHNTTGFPLTGFHTTMQCAQCHVNNNYAIKTALCSDCHTTDYNATNNPPHKAAGFPTDCTLCHTTANWTSATFNHNTTGFPLTGFHTTLQCAQCHVNNNYAIKTALCSDCHMTDYNGTTDPPHKAAGYPTTCDQCHSTASWAGATFNHASTGFALTGFHATMQCVQCHVNNNYAIKTALCSDCHMTDYNGTNNPPHKASNFPTDCSLCHSTTNWAGAVFNHSTTGFTLVGKHATATCIQCHVSNNYNLTSAACYNCHQPEYAATNNPPHAASGFPTTCDTCHLATIIDWTGAVFDHSKTPFPLTGAHLTVACNLCHIGNVFVGTPTDCYSCHKADYTGTNNPNHVAVGFPTTCATCHTTTAWTGATFNHTWFPITSGNHNVACAVCHINSADYSVFSCDATCHAKATTDRNHSGVKNYVWNATSCYGCHPTGRAG